MNAKPMIGKIFGRWTVLEHAGKQSNRHSLWLCLCMCGNKATVSGTHLRGGKSMSCGCLRREATTVHGMANIPEYQCWADMHARCTNPKIPNFPYYGARGISVCERWQIFENFYADMGSRPSPTHSLDRKDNDGNYEPGNCRWATKFEQSKNQRHPRRNPATGCFAGSCLTTEAA